MNKSLIKILDLPITIISIILMTAGALGLGYSFVTIILNNNYIENEASVIEKLDDSGTKRVVIEYGVNEKIYNGSFPFLEKYLNKKIIIGYNPANPSRFHFGDQNSHFRIFIWGLFLEMLGLVFITLKRQYKRLKY